MGVPLVCCDVCQPGAVTLLGVSEVTQPTTRRKRKANIKPYTMELRDNDLQRLLSDWRTQQLKAEGLEDDTIFGPAVILPNSLLKRIVDLAHHFKITSIETLHEHTRWRYAYKYGDAVLNIILTQRNSLASSTSSETLVPATTSSTRKCHGCGNVGHICEYVRSYHEHQY